MDQVQKKLKISNNDPHYIPSLCDLPTELLKIIISYRPCRQWFMLCKKLKILASIVINPLNFHCGDTLYWAIQKNNVLAVASLLKDPRIDPSYNYNCAIQNAVENIEITKLLLQDPRVDPSAEDNLAIQNAG
jgi:hypothetical protein